MMASAAVWAAIVLACDGTERPLTVLPDGDSADQILYGMEHLATTDGVLRVRLRADSGYYYESTQTWELFVLDVLFYSSMGEHTSTVTSEEGTYELRTKNMQARGNVVGVTPEGRRLTTSVLNYEATLDELNGPEPFVFDAPGQHLEGASFRADPDFSRVRATDLRGTPGSVEGNR